jgi:hypothetical protein
VSLEGALNLAIAKEKESKKKMNASNARALNGMKQKVKKTVKDFEKEVKAFQEVCVEVSVHPLFKLTLPQGPRQVRRGLPGSYCCT